MVQKEAELHKEVPFVALKNEKLKFNPYLPSKTTKI